MKQVNICENYARKWHKGIESHQTTTDKHGTQIAIYMYNAKMRWQ